MTLTRVGMKKRRKTKEQKKQIYVGFAALENVTAGREPHTVDELIRRSTRAPSQLPD
jgi:hypothetical protein